MELEALGAGSPARCSTIGACGLGWTTPSSLASRRILGDRALDGFPRPAIGRQAPQAVQAEAGG